MSKTVLEFECVRMDNGGKFPVEYTGQDISPEFVIISGGYGIFVEFVYHFSVLDKFRKWIYNERASHAMALKS